MTLYIAGAIWAAAIWAAGFSQVEVSPGLYAALLDERYHGMPASQMVVKDRAVAMPTLRGSSSEWLGQFNEVPSDLRRAASEPSPTRPHRLAASLFPTGVRLVPAESVETIFARSGVEENWSTFRSQFNTVGWLAFSGGLFADDQLNALVYYEARCEGLCGEGGYAWLHRATILSPWRIAKKIIRWQS